MKKIYLLIIAAFCIFASNAQIVSLFSGQVGNLNPNVPATQIKSQATYISPTNIFYDYKNKRYWVVENINIYGNGGNRVRMIDSASTPASGTTYCRAGSLSGASGSADLSGTAASFYSPSGIVLDTNGNIYVADAGNHCIRKISPFINLSTQQTVTTFAGIKGLSGYLDATGTAAKFYFPSDLAIDANQNIYVADMGNHCIRKITPAGVVTTVAGSINPGNWNGTGSAAAFQAPSGLGWYINPEKVYINGVLLPSYELLITDPTNSNIRLLNINSNVVTNVAGTGAPGNTDGDTSVATFTRPIDVTCDSNSNIYVVDSFSNVIRKIAGSCVTTFAGTAGVSGSANGTGAAASFRSPAGIIFSNGMLYVTDFGNSTIRAVTPTSTPRDSNPSSKFKVDSIIGHTNTVFTFTDLTTTPVTKGRLWKFSPSTYTYVSGDSTTAVAKVTFTARGNYTVSLTTRNCSGSNTLIGGGTINVNYTGVNEVNADKFVSVYPNPSNGKFDVELSNTSSTGITIHVLDINGKTILNQTMNSSRESIDISDFAKGVYILNISGNDFNANKKLVVE